MTLLPNAISPLEEMISYETLWGLPNQTRRGVGDLLRRACSTPSSALQELKAGSLFGADVDTTRARVVDFIAELNGFSVCVRGDYQYPEQLRDTEVPVALFYYRGEIDLALSPSVSVVGTRQATPQGMRIAADVGSALVAAGYTVVSGLAAGIDTAAMRAAIDAKGRTIGVIGTPINAAYPRSNESLQEDVAKRHLLMSEVPFFRYEHQAFPTRKYYFPRRNEVMAALSAATVIVEAAETSGTRTQARACKRQGRLLIIMSHAADQPVARWLRQLLDVGEAHLAQRTADVLDLLNRWGGDGAPLEEDRPGRIPA